MNLNTILLGILGANELLMILLVVVLLFGGRKIPELMRGLGKGLREFKNASQDIKEEIKDLDPTKEIKDKPEK